MSYETSGTLRTDRVSPTDEEIEVADWSRASLGSNIVNDNGVVRFASTSTFVFDSESTDVGGHQGIASDGTNIYLSTSDPEPGVLYKRDKSGTLVDSRTAPEEDGTTMTQVADLQYHADDGLLYGASNNYSDTADRGYIKIWDPSDLSYIEEHRVLDYVVEGCAYNDGSWWVVYDDYDFVSEYDSNWNHIADYALTFDLSGGDHGYQGIVWVGDYIYVNVHTGPDSQTCDVYRWNGSGFDKEARLNRPTDSCTQGMHKEPGTDVMWWAERNSGTSTHDMVKSTFNHTNGKPEGG